MNKKILLISLGSIAVLGIVGWRIAASRAPKIEYDTYDVARQTLRQTVEATGEVVSTQDVDLKFETSGRLKSVSKNVGDKVKADDIVAILDDRSQAVDVQRAQASLLSAEAALNRVADGSTPEQIRIDQVNVDNAQAALDKAQTSLRDTQASGDASIAKAYGDLSGQIESLYLKSAGAMQLLKTDVFDAVGNLRADVSSPDFSTQSQALSAYAAAKTALGSMDADIVAYRAAPSDADRLSATIIAEGQRIRDAAALANALMQASVPINGTTQASFDVRKADVKATWSDLNAGLSAAISQKLLVASSIASDTSATNAATQAVRTAEGALESARASLALKQAPATASDLASARAGVAQAQAALGAAHLAFDKTRLRAPFDGTIAQVPSRAGSTITQNDVVAKLHGDDVYEIEADVPETDIAKLTVGLKAEITLDAYGDGVKFDGGIVSIDTAQTVIQDVVYYKTRFRFSAQDRAVRAGMTANVTVTAQERQDVLVVPQRAIRQNGERSVRVLENGVETKKVVEVGLFGDDGLVQIVSGLSDGEKVILASRQAGKIIKE